MGTNLANIIITQPNGNRVPMQNRRTATGVVSAKQNWALNAEDTVGITVESPFPQTYNIGDRITIFGRDYKLNRLPSVKKTGMHEFQYTLQFEGVQYDLFRVTYDLTIDTTTNELQDIQGDSLTGNLRRFMTVLVANANRVFPGKWKLGACPDTIGDKTLTFGESDNCLSVLQNLCGESNFNVEFDIVQADGIYTINLYERVGQTLPYKFEYGKGRGLYDLHRENVSSANIVTRLKVYGSTENITSKYRADRLCLPGRTKGQSYIEKAEMVAKYGIFEGRKNFDNVKPTFTGSIESKVDEFSFIDTKFPFDLNAKNADGETLYLINGVSAKIHFNTGNLAGYDFEVKAYDHATHKFTLIKTTDDRGDVFPSETSVAFQFGVGNEYKVLDIAYSPEIEAQAEADLEEVGNKYYDQNCQPKVQYGLSVHKSYLEKIVGTPDSITNVFAPGDYLHVVDKDIDVDKAIRVKSFVRNILDPYEYTLTISDTVTGATITNRVISDLVELDKIVTINNLKDPTRARANWRSSREVLNMVFDPEGDYYTDKIKPNSIDTMALSVGAKSMQFGLMNTVFQPNFQGNNNVVKWQGGVLTHYTINEESAVSWVMADAQTTLTSNVPYYLYAKCEKNGTAGSFIFTASQIKVDEDENYYHFLVGTLSSTDPELKARSLALTYGFTMINGRFIKTGRIESADGTTYFDLDNSEIGGRIVFNSNGSEKTLEELGKEALESKDFINNTLPGLFGEIEAQIDGKVETWFQTTDPSNVWTTAEKKKHVGDLWYNTETKESKRFSDSYSWEVLEDKDAKNALEAASKAQDTADGKRRVFVNTPTTPYDVGDLWVQGATGDIMRCKTTRTSGEYTATDWERASKYTGDEELNSFIDSIYTPAINEIFKQLDGVIETWFASGVPTLNNAPASDWTTNTDKDMHLGDIYYNNDDGTAYRFSKDGSVYKWIEISDSAIASAMQAAAEAQDTADGKRRVFVTTPTTPYDVGDLWANGTFLKVCKNSKGKNAAYAESDWENATNYTSDESLHNFINGVFDETIGEIKSQIDGKIECWYQTTSPSRAWSLAEKPKHVGDMWFNTSSKELKYYRQLSASSFLWTKVEDADAIAAQEAASKAQDTADGKRRVFVTTPTTPYDVGDLWVQGEDGDIMRCKTARASGSYSSSDWDKASKYTDDSGLNDFINNTYNPNIDDILEQIDGKVECWFQTTDPSGAWNTTALKKKHVGDMWYHTTKNELKYYTSSYAWKKVEDANALAAYDAASKAQDTADGKRQVFVDTPKVPYDIGDLWVDGKDLRRCQTKKTATQAYNVNDWVVAVAYDNTQTVIDGGLVTSGTIQVAGDNTSILAGITGNGTTSTSVRFWAGASFENRATAPFRVLQDGSLHATKAYIEGEIHATKGTFKNVDVYGSFRSPFVIISDSFKEQQSDNLYSQYLGSHLVCSLPWDNASSGRRITVIGSVSISAPSGKYFFEDGRTHSELSTSYEVVELLGWGGSSFQGYIVLSRTMFKSNYGHGRRIHPLAYGTVTGSSSSASIKYWSFDGNTMTVTRMSTGKYKITFPTNWFYSSDYIIALATGVGSNVGGDNPVYANIMTRYKSSTEAYIIVRTADDDSENDGAFTFMLYNASTWND